jgi:hypothetical protein
MQGNPLFAKSRIPQHPFRQNSYMAGGITNAGQGFTEHLIGAPWAPRAAGLIAPSYGRSNALLSCAVVRSLVSD